MILSVEMITVDSLDPDRLAAWWARVLRGEVTVVIPGEFVLVEHAGGPRLGFQRVHDPTPGKNRVHIDFAARDLETEVERLVSLGAVETAHHRYGADFRWIVLQDPDGNAFCVGAAQE
jgi:predicted enzyme related to lactoylglutathione lyase